VGGVSTLATALLDEDPEVAERYRRHFLDAIDEVHRIARNIGLDPFVAQQATWQLRCDAWCHRVDRLLGASVALRREVAA
jgi:hypothetical protein